MLTTPPHPGLPVVRGAGFSLLFAGSALRVGQEITLVESSPPRRDSVDPAADNRLVQQGSARKRRFWKRQGFVFMSDRHAVELPKGDFLTYRVFSEFQDGILNPHAASCTCAACCDDMTLVSSRGSPGGAGVRVGGQGRRDDPTPCPAHGSGAPAADPGAVTFLSQTLRLWRRSDAAGGAGGELAPVSPS